MDVDATTGETVEATRVGPAHRLADLVGERLRPVLLVSVQPFIVAFDPHAEGSLAARLGWAAVIALSCAAGPRGILAIWIRRGKITSGHRVRERAERLAPLTAALGLVAAGVTALQIGHAPTDLRALVWAMLVGLAITGAVTAVWKISVHTAVMAGTVTVLVLVFGPLAAITAPLVLLVAWSRVLTGDHTLAQVIAGAVMGAGVAYAVFTALT
jgi:membrane-associated phospholipid phosphatase